MSDTLPLTLIRVQQLGGSPYAGFAVQAHAALLDEGLSDPSMTMVGWDTNAIVARVGRDEQMAVGIITYSYLNYCARLDIGVGFVVPDFRRRGVYRAMWDEIVLEAQRLKATKILGTTYIKNDRMVKVAVALGRRAESYNLVFEVPTE